MPDVVKHAWTHRPRAQGGTDPIEIPGSVVPVGIMSDGITSRTTGSKLYMTFGSMWTNDSTVFGYSNVTSAKAKFMTIAEEGVYRAEGQMSWDSDFTAGDTPRLVFATNQASVDGDLIPAMDIYWENESGIWDEQISADDMDHHKLWTSAVFEFTAAGFGESPLKVGLALYSNNSRTKAFGGQLAVYRISTAAMAEVTIS